MNKIILLLLIAINLNGQTIEFCDDITTNEIVACLTNPCYDQPVRIDNVKHCDDGDIFFSWWINGKIIDNTSDGITITNPDKLPRFQVARMARRTNSKTGHFVSVSNHIWIYYRNCGETITDTIYHHSYDTLTTFIDSIRIKDSINLIDWPHIVWIDSVRITDSLRIKDSIDIVYEYNLIDSCINEYDAEVSIVEVGDKGLAKIIIYPNPSSQCFDIDLIYYEPTQSATNTQIYNYLGQLVWEGPFKKHYCLNPGVYRIVFFVYYDGRLIEITRQIQILE